MCPVKDALIAWGHFRAKYPEGYPEAAFTDQVFWEAVASLGKLDREKRADVKAVFATLWLRGRLL